MQQKHPDRKGSAGVGRDIAIEERRCQKRLEAEKEQQHQDFPDARILEQNTGDGDERMIL